MFDYSTGAAGDLNSWMGRHRVVQGCYGIFVYWVRLYMTSLVMVTDLTWVGGILNELGGSASKCHRKAKWNLAIKRLVPYILRTTTVPLRRADASVMHPSFSARTLTILSFHCGMLNISCCCHYCIKNSRKMYNSITLPHTHERHNFPNSCLNFRKGWFL